jgi:CheY-like chemotaxis protein
LLTFSRKELTELKVLSLNVPVRECLDLFGRMLGEKVQLVVTLDPALGDVMADSGQIHQILMNLVLNAGTAMPRGGRFGISTANLPIPCSQLSVPAAVPPGSYVLLSVSDTGIGIDPELRERIFEPFFTTRQTGHGLGLGLTTVFGIVQRHHGWIFLDSTPGVGSTFHILLPRTLSGKVDETTPSEHPSHGGKTVLVVEDDEQVRQLAVTILERTGFHVLSAGMGGDALLMAERFAGQIDLMLTDAIMPYMNGRELAERLTVLRPGLRVLFMSGYSENVITQSDVSGGINFIGKPFTAIALRQKLAEVLAAAPYQSAPSPARDPLSRDAGT